MPALLDRIFVAGYDRLLAATEDAGLREERARLLARAKGDVVELGAGTGLNRQHYPDAVGRLVLTEPDPHMAKRLRDRADGAEVVEAGAERLPLPDASADTVVSTLVLCTVGDADATLREVARVLRPGGELLFYEHVRAPDGHGLTRWQDRLERPWGWFAGGCHPNRDTPAALEASPLEVVEIRTTKLPKAPPIVRPAVVGVARRPA